MQELSSRPSEGLISGGRPPPSSTLEHEARANAVAWRPGAMFDGQFHDPEGCYWNNHPFPL